MMKEIYRLLLKAGVSEQDIETGMSYIEGGADESVLDGLSKYDFTGLPYDIYGGIYGQQFKLKNSEKYDILERYLRYAYRLGGYSAYRIVSNSTYPTLFELKKIKGAEIELILEISDLISHRNVIYATINRSIERITVKDNSIIKKAITLLENEQNYSNDMTEKYKFIKIYLYTLYFMLEYKRVAKEDIKVPYYARKVILADIKNDEDAAMLEQYEDILIENMNYLFTRVLNETEEKQISDMLKGNAQLSDISDIIRGLKLSNDKKRVMYIACVFANFALSSVLKNIITLCVAIDEKETLANIARPDYRDDFAIRGGNFDDEFGISALTLINFAISNSNVNVLRRQYEKNKDIIIDIYNNLDYENGEKVMKVIKELDKAQADKMIREGEELLKKKIADIAYKLTGCQSEVEAYLFENADISVLYEAESRMHMRYDSSRTATAALWKYINEYGFNDFAIRCLVLSTYTKEVSWFAGMLVNNEELKVVLDSKRIDNTYRKLVSSGMDAVHLVKVIAELDEYFSYHGSSSKAVIECEISLFTELLEKKREEYVDAFAKSTVAARLIAFEIYKKKPEEYHEEILEYFKDTAVSVKKVLIEYMSKDKNYRSDVAKKLESKKVAERETAVRILGKYDEAEDIELIKSAYTKEKSEKLKAVMEDILKIDTKSDIDQISAEDMVKNILKGNKKRSLEWAYATPFSKVHYKSDYKDGVVCDDEYIQAILVAYASVTPSGISNSGRNLASNLDEHELAVFMNELFDKWVELGAKAKNKWVLYAASVHGGNDMVKKLNTHIKEWPAASRGAIASEAVYALALNPAPEALLIVDSIARKFKFKQVKNAAGNALTYAAGQLGITRAELEDRIVPALSFDSNMERVFDYGNRTFRVVLTQTLALEIYDEKGKKLKNLPSPGAKDDVNIAKAAYEEYKDLKKQLKTVVASQKMRLDEALSVNRTWTVDKWKTLFVDNPIMHQFAIGLIWGIYEDGKLTDTFRYMEDGTFNTIDEEEYNFDNVKSNIGLVHPIELTDEQIAEWKEQLEDYEVVQPLEQLDREVFRVTEEEKKSKELVRYAGIIINDLTLTGRMLKFGWYKGSVIDGGGFVNFYREDGEFGTELSFEGAYVSPFGESTTIYETRFYKAGTIERGSYVYDYANDKKAIELGDIPCRYFSEIVLQLKQITAGCEERDNDWRKHK